MREGDYDLAGFCVGAVERGEALTGDRVEAGDVILGLASSGVHSNGFSLVRRLAADKGWKLDRPALFDQDRAADRGAARADPDLCEIAAAAGPGGRIPRWPTSPAAACSRTSPRVLPEGLHARIDADAWPQPRLMAFLQAQGNIEPEEMARTFNCGIGMAVIVSEDDVKDVSQALERRRNRLRDRPRRARARRAARRRFGGTWSARADWTATHHG
jgi:phosphoribosylformylglycinamidine cyclo-ligase